MDERKEVVIEGVSLSNLEALFDEYVLALEGVRLSQTFKGALEGAFAITKMNFSVSKTFGKEDIDQDLKDKAENMFAQGYFLGLFYGLTNRGTLSKTGIDVN